MNTTLINITLLSWLAFELILKLKYKKRWIDIQVPYLLAIVSSILYLKSESWYLFIILSYLVIVFQSRLATHSYFSKELINKKLIFSTIFTIFSIFRLFAFDIYFTNSESMYPTLERSEIGFIGKKQNVLHRLAPELMYPQNEVKRGDIVVFHDDSGRVFVKRIVALEKDTVEYKDKLLKINGIEAKGKRVGDLKDKGLKVVLEKLPMTNDWHSVVVDDSKEDKPEKYKKANGCVTKSESLVCFLEKDQMFVMGDNRDNSKDSRELGVIDKSNIIAVLYEKL